MELDPSGEGGEGWVRGETGDGNWVLRLRDLGGGGSCSEPTVALDEVKNTVGTSWGRHISHSDFTA